MRTQIILITATTIALASPAISLAATPNPTVSESPSPEITVSPEATPTPEASVSPSPLPPVTVDAGDLATERTPWLTKLSLFFTFKKDAKTYQRRLRLANTYLLAAQVAAKKGQTDKATSLLDKYNSELQSVQQFIASQSPQSTDPAVKQLVDQLMADNTIQLASLDSMAQVKAAAQFNSKIVAEQLAVSKKLAQLLSRNLTSDELAEKVAQLSEKLAKKDQKAADKYQRKLDFIAKLKAADDDSSLKSALDDQEAEQLTEASTKLDDDQLEGLAEKGDDRTARIDALTKALANAPEAAKPALTRVLAKLQAKETKDQHEAAADDTVTSGSSTSKSKAKKTEKKSSPTPKASSSSKLNIKQESHSSGSSHTATDIKISTDDGQTGLKTELDSGKTPTAEFTVTLTDDGCGTALSASAGTQVKIIANNISAAARTYTVQGYGSITVRPDSHESLSFTAKAGTTTISCDNGRSTTLTVS